MSGEDLVDLPQNEEGATIIEFALVSPVLLLLLMAIFDLSMNLYLDTMLQGTMQEAGRDSSMESADEAEIDAKVLAKSGQSCRADRFARRSYRCSMFGSPRSSWTRTATASAITANSSRIPTATGCTTMIEARRPGRRRRRGRLRRPSHDRVFPLHAYLGLPDRIMTTGTTVLRNQLTNCAIWWVQGTAQNACTRWCCWCATPGSRSPSLPPCPS